MVSGDRSAPAGWQSGEVPPSLDELIVWLKKRITNFRRFPERHLEYYGEAPDSVTRNNEKALHRYAKTEYLTARLEIADDTGRHLHRWLDHYGVSDRPDWLGDWSADWNGVVAAEAYLVKLQVFLRRLSNPSDGDKGDSDTSQRHGIEPTESAKPTGKRAATINERMLGTIAKNQDAMPMGWNSRQWAEYLKCAKSSVVETEAWKKLEIARLKAKAERKKDRRRKPKASDQRRD